MLDWRIGADRDDGPVTFRQRRGSATLANLTDDDRRGIEEIRRQLDVEFGAAARGERARRDAMRRARLAERRGLRIPVVAGLLAGFALGGAAGAAVVYFELPALLSATRSPTSSATSPATAGGSAPTSAHVPAPAPASTAGGPSLAVTPAAAPGVASAPPAADVPAAPAGPAASADGASAVSLAPAPVAPGSVASPPADEDRVRSADEERAPSAVPRAAAVADKRSKLAASAPGLPPRPGGQRLPRSSWSASPTSESRR